MNRVVNFDDNDGPGFRYEGLARAAFDNCGKGEDAFGVTMQEVYSHFVPVPTQEGKEKFYIVIDKLITDSTDVADQNFFLDMRARIKNATTQDEIIDVIDRSRSRVNRICG